MTNGSLFQFSIMLYEHLRKTIISKYCSMCRSTENIGLNFDICLKIRVENKAGKRAFKVGTGWSVTLNSLLTLFWECFDITLYFRFLNFVIEYSGSYTGWSKIKVPYACKWQECNQTDAHLKHVVALVWWNIYANFHAKCPHLYCIVIGKLWNYSSVIPPNVKCVYW